MAELRRFHRPRLEVLADAGADVLALETIPCLAEVEALLAELDRLPGTPAWLSLTCSNGRTRRGEDPAAAYRMARDVAGVVAVGVNCTDPQQVADLLPTMALADRPMIVYPNSGEAWDAERRAWLGDVSFSTALVEGWLEAGVGGVGGCCRVGPAQIHGVSEALGRPRG